MSRQKQFEALVEKYQTEDGLIPCKHIYIRPSPHGYDLVFSEDKDLELFPVRESDFVVNALVSRPDLWVSASARFTYYPSIWGSAPIFGVPFSRAIELAKKSGHEKAKYYIPDHQLSGGYKSLLLHLRTVNDVRGPLLQVEAWQYTPGDNYAHYLHALSPDFELEVFHLDGATIHYSESDLDTLLQSTKKVKGQSYRKHFRLDGNFNILDMHLLAGAFLPGQQLYKEALGVEFYV